MPSPGLTGHHQQKSEEWPTAILVPCDMPSSSLPTSIIRSPDSNHKPWVLLTHPPSYSCVIANFICQVDWIMRCPDSWLNIISGCGCEGVSGRVAICILSKVDGPPQCEWHHSVCWGSEKKKKVEESWLCCLLECMSWHGDLSTFQTFIVGYESTPLGLCPSGLQSTVPAFLGLLLADSRSWDLLAFIIAWANIL